MAGSAARTYARAIFELAKEEGQVDAWYQRLGVVRETLTHPEARTVLANPSIPARWRQEAVTALLEKRVGPEGVNLAKLLIGASRLDDIVQQARDLSSLGGLGRRSQDGISAWDDESSVQHSPAERQDTHLSRPPRLLGRL